MSDLQEWLEGVKVRLKDAELGGLGTRDVVGEDALQADNTAKLVYGDLPALIAKVEELAEVFGDVPDLLREIADNARNGNAGEMERLVCTAAYLEDQAGLMDDALRAPEGGKGELSASRCHV